MEINYTHNIDNINTKLKEKATEFERGIEQQISEATRRLKIKSGKR